MTVTLREQGLGEQELGEQELGGLRWIVAGGPDGPAVFRALGAHLRTEIASFICSSPWVPALRRHLATEPAQRRLAAVRATSQARFPAEWAELAALADGSGTSLDDLLLLNFRGDLGIVSYAPADGRASTEAAGADTARTDGAAGAGIAAADPTGRGTADTTGCSDLAWRRASSVIAHNEDGAVAEDGQCMLLTLAIESEPRCTAFWYPVFLPGNAFAVTGDGLVWAIDALDVTEPGPGGGRHFVGRGMQRTARTISAAVSYLGEHPSAGGFCYNIGDRAGRVVSVDAAAGQLGWAEVGPDAGHGPLNWHTNHARYLSDPRFSATGSSTRRGEVLAALPVPPDEPQAGWFLRALAGAPMPDGVRVDPAGPAGGATLCTFVADLTAGEAVLLPRGSDPVAIPLADLAAGDPSRQRPASGPR